MSDNTSKTQHITSLDFDITSAISQLEELQNKFDAVTNKLSSKNWSIKAVLEGSDGYGELKQEANSLAAETLKLTSTIKNSSKEYANNLDMLRGKLKQFEAELKLTEARYDSNSDSLEALTAKSQKYSQIADTQRKIVAGLSEKVKQATSEYGENTKEVDKWQLQLTQAETALQKTENSISQTNETIVNLGGNIEDTVVSTGNLASAIESKLVNALKNASVAAYEATKDTEDSMLEISRVLNLTTSETEKLRNSLFDLGKEYGRSFADTADIALRYAQAGNDMNDTLSLTNDFLLALNTAELDVENGVQSLIGIMNQWGMSASDLSTVIDKLNYTADNNAVTTQDLVDGLLKASSMAKTAGMSFDDTVGSLTAMKVASGAAGKEVGNAFKSIMAYIQRPDSLKTFDSMGIEVFKDKVTGELLPMMEILQNMSKKWNTSQEEMLNTLIESGDALQMMSEEWAIATDSMEEYTKYQETVAEATDKANNAESRAQAQAAAGVFRRNYYISLMENFNKAMEISADLVNSEGHSMAENSRYMETLTAKTEQLQTALVELAVTAADAHLLDFAKMCLDAATNVTQWVTNTKTLIPLLVSLAGIMLTIKQRKIAHEITNVATSFKNGLSAIGSFAKGMVNIAKGADAASTSAKTAAISFNSVLGAIGLITTAIGLVNATIQKYHAKNQALIEQGNEAYKTADSILDLSKRYSELSEISVRTAEQDEEYKNVQQSIVELLGVRAEKLKELTEGSKEYNDELKKQIELELKSQEADIINASVAAKKELDSTVFWKTTGSYGVTYGSEVYNAFDSADKIGYNSNGDPTVFYNGKNALETYSNLSELMDILNDKLRELESTNSELANDFVNDSTYKKIKENYEQVGEAVEQYLEAEVKRQSIKYVLDPNNELPKTIQEQEAMNKAIIEAIDPTGRLADEITELIEVYGTIDQQKVDFFELINLDEYENVKNALIDIAKAGELNEKTLNSVSRSIGTDLIPKLDEMGLSTEDCIKYINELAASEKTVEKNMSDMADEMEDTDEKLQSFADTISSSESSISSLNKYIETLNSGSGLTAQQVMELCDTYGLLAEQFTLTENGYKIEVSALETLRNAHIEDAVAARNSQIEQTQVMQTELLKRIKGYGLEITSISNLAEAQAALAEIEYELEHGPNGGTSDAKRKQGLMGVRTEIQSIADAYENTQNLADDFYKNLGKSFESVSTSAGKAKDTTEETIDTFKVLTEGFEHLVSLGAYSVDEQIAYYEKLRRELDLTEEQYRSLETTLHKLYRSQVDEQVEAVKEAYEQQKQAVEDYYDGEKEALKKALEEEKSAREEYWDDEISKLKDNLNSQIKAAKSAYEEKKKLADKSYDNQIKALESLRDTELDNIKAVYDAQISALEKIKAARNSERDEEDYQDKRAELLEQISYWEQRTSTEAVENIANLKKQLADLDKSRKREREDEETDNQISSLKEQRDSETVEAEKYYNAQIAALKAAQDTELEMYETTYNREIELLEKRLETEVKALEKKRDDDLKLLDEQQEKKLADLDAAKEAAIKAEEDKWAAIQEMFTEQNLNLIASAGEFAPKLYDQFHELFTKKFEMDLKDLSKSIKELDKAKSKLESGASGSKPSYSAPKSVGKSPTVPSSTSSSGSSSGNSSSGGYALNTQVRVSGTLYGDSYGGSPGKTVKNLKSTITGTNSKGTKPYHVGSLGWVDESQLVKARTGGKTTADGIAMLHKDELIINPPTTKKLEDLMKELRPKPTEADIKAKQDAVLAYWCREIGKTQQAMIQAVQNHNNTYNTRNTNNVSNSYRDENSRQIIQNFNAPLQNIEKVEDGADINAAVNAMEREIMRKMAGML